MFSEELVLTKRLGGIGYKEQNFKTSITKNSTQEKKIKNKRKESWKIVSSSSPQESKLGINGLIVDNKVNHGKF